MSAPGNQNSYAAKMMADIRAALDAKDYARATRLARDALAGGIVHPVLLTLRANELQNQGRYGDALSDLRRAVTMAPKDIVALNSMGLCLQAMDKFGEALQAFNAALVIRAEFPPALFNRGHTLELMGEIAAARADYEAALKLDPEFAEPSARLALLATRRLDWGEARAHATHALANDPELSPALLALATTDMEEGDLSGAKERIASMLASARLSPSDRGIALGMMGDVLDREDRVGEAFAAYTEGNATLRQLYAPRYAAPNMQTARGFVQSQIDYFSKADDKWASAPQSGGGQAAGHVFVVGFPRSGTTLLEQALAGHPRTVAISEKEFLIDAFREFMGSTKTLDRLAGIDAETAARFGELYWQRMRAAGIDPSGKIVIDKQPLNTVKLPLVAKLFPDAKIVLARRDPRDVVLSCFRRRFQMNIDMFEFLTLQGTAAYYDAVMQLSELYRGKLALAMMVSRHEDMIADFDKQMRAICAFIGMEWDEKMRGFADRAANAFTPSAPQLMAGLNGEGAGQWRRYREQLAPVLPMLSPWAKKFGYSEK